MFDFKMLSCFDSNCELVANGSLGLKDNVFIKVWWESIFGGKGLGIHQRISI